MNFKVAGVMLAVLSASGLGASAASAQDGDSSLEIDGFAGASSSYRDRGLRLSDGDVAAFASVAAFHGSGFYLGVDGASINDGFGNDARTEFYAGYNWEDGTYIYDVSLELEGIHGKGSEYYPEVKASIARDFGLAYIKGGMAYAPEGRWNTPDVDSFYNYLDLELPLPWVSSLTLLTHVGYDFRSSGKSNLWDWSVGVSSFVWDNFEISLSYASSSLDQTIGKDGFVLGARIYF